MNKKLILIIISALVLSISCSRETPTIIDPTNEEATADSYETLLEKIETLDYAHGIPLQTRGFWNYFKSMIFCDASGLFYSMLINPGVGIAVGVVSSLIAAPVYYYAEYCSEDSVPINMSTIPINEIRVFKSYCQSIITLAEPEEIVKYSSDFKYLVEDADIDDTEKQQIVSAISVAGSSKLLWVEKECDANL